MPGGGAAGGCWAAGRAASRAWVRVVAWLMVVLSAPRRAARTWPGRFRWARRRVARTWPGRSILRLRPPPAGGPARGRALRGGRGSSRRGGGGGGRGGGRGGPAGGGPGGGGGGGWGGRGRRRGGGR